ncbi:hypothetical protein Tco_0331621 [Tanacetum coccineum]
MSTIRDIKSKLNQKALDALCTKYHIPASVHPSLPGSDKNILQSPSGKIGVYTRFFDFANYRIPLSQFLVEVLDHFHIHLSQLSVFGAAKVSHFEILCRVHGFQPSVNCFRMFYTSSYTKGWMSFVKRSETAHVCHSKPLDSVKNWNDHFFWVDSTVFPLSVSLKSKILKMDLFAFIRHSDPTKVRVGERNLAEREVKLLKMTEGRTVPLNPPVAAASGGSGDSVDKMFDEGDDANQEHLVERDDDVLEEVVALDASGVGAEKAKKRQKRKATGDASGSDYPPKKLRDDYQPLPPPTGGKSLSALREMIPEGFAIPSDVMGPLSTAFATPVSDVGPVDSVSGLNLRTLPPHERYVISPDSSHHSDSYSEAASLVRSVADVPVVTVAVTTTADANVATGSKAKDVPKGFEHIGDSASAGGIEADAVSISKLKKPSISSDSFYASQSLDTETLHRVYVPRWKVTNDSVLDDPYVCRDMTDRLAPCAIYTAACHGL